MNAETMKVLEMVADGTLAIDDANLLLKALRDAEAPPRPEAPGSFAPRPRSRPRGPRGQAGSLPIDQLVEMSKHGVDADFIQELRAAGYLSLTPDELINLAKHGVDADFLRELRDAGFDRLSMDDLVRLQNHGVDANFIQGLRSMGYADLSTDDLVRLHDEGIDPDAIDELRRALE